MLASLRIFDGFEMFNGFRVFENLKMLNGFELLDNFEVFGGFKVLEMVINKFLTESKDIETTEDTSNVINISKPSSSLLSSNANNF